MGTWQKTYPNENHKINEIPGVVQDNFDAIEDLLAIEHYGITSGEGALSGEHKLAGISTIYEGTTESIAGLTPVTGALAYDTTLGVLVRYTGSAWARTGASYWSRIRAYDSTTLVVTAGASAQTLVYNVENYDTLSEYDTTSGTFTPLASGYYIVVAQVTMVCSSSALTESGVTSATGQISATWQTSGSSTNWQNVDEYPTPNDSDLNCSQTSGATDILSGAIPSIPSGASSIAVSVTFRSRRRGCVCNNACYGEGCTCNSSCYEYSCTCYNACYDYQACSCNATCYSEGGGKGGGGCGCYNTCYDYQACSCDNTTYEWACSCYNTVYGSAGCSCDTQCYVEDATRPAALLRKGGVSYFGTTTTPTTSFADYEETWVNDPSTGLAWTAAGVSGIQGFGYTTITASAGCSADISQCYTDLAWYPLRPVIGIHLYKNGALYQSAYRPVTEAGSASYQASSIYSVLQLIPGDVVKIAYTKTVNNDWIYADGSLTYLSIHRMPVDCL